MADNILKLKVDSQEYDQKLKRAAEGIKRYADGCRAAGGTLEYLDEGVLQFVQALGKMDTVATTSRQQMREMSNALTTLTMTYRGLTEEEKNSPFGQELAKGMQELTSRAGNIKDAMKDVERGISGFASDTRVFDQIAQGANLMTSSFQTAAGAAKMLGIDMGDNVEVIAKLQAAMAVTTGLTQIQNALQKESALMQGVLAVQAKAAAAATALQASATKGATVAQAAFNTVAKANPYVLLASAVAAVGTALVAFTGNSKKAEEATKTETEAMRQAARMADIWKNTMASTYSSLMTKYDALSRQWNALKDNHQRTEWIKQNEKAMRDLGGAVTDVKTAEDFFNNNTDAVVQAFVRRAQAAARVAQLTELYRKQIELIDKKQQTQQAISDDAAKYGRSAVAGQEIKDASYWNSRYGSVNQSTGKWEFTEQGAKLYSGTDTSTADAVVKIDVQLKANQSEIDKVKGQITNEFKDVVIPGTGGNGSGDKTLKDISPFNVPSIKPLDALSLTESKQMLQEQLKSYQQMLNEATNMFTAGVAQKGIEDTQRLLDAQPLALKMGISADAAADIIEKTQSLRDFVQKSLDEEVVRLGIEPNPQGGTSKGKGKESDADEDKLSEAVSNMQKVNGGIGQLTNGIQQLGIKLPEGLQRALSVMQGMTNIISGVTTLMNLLNTTETASRTANTAALTTLTGALIANTAALEVNSAASFLPFAGGGIIPHAASGYFIPGNNYSGDATPIMANAGELVLNKAQQGNLASMLTEGENRGGGGQPYVSGEQIYIGLNNYLRRSGRGELVTARG